MAAPRVLVPLAKAAVALALVAPPVAVWLSGRFGEDDPLESRPPASAPPATFPRREAAATPSSRPPPAPDVAPSPAPPVTVAPGLVTLPAPAPGAAVVPAPRAGRVVGEPQGLPDPNRSEATPR